MKQKSNPKYNPNDSGSGMQSSSGSNGSSGSSSKSFSDGEGDGDKVSVRLHDDSLPSKRRKGSFQSVRQRRRRTVTSVVSGLRKQRSVLHGTGTSKWWQSRNWYYLLLDMRFLRLMGWILLTYIVICLMWSLLSWPLFDEIFCDLPDDNAITQSAFGTAFVFATSNVLTMGSGMCYAQGYIAALVGFLQNFIGIIINVAVFSIFVVKLQQPRPEVIFSSQALITTRDGEPIFMFRIGNKRVNLLYNPAVYVSLLEPYQTSEGETFVRYRHLKVEFPNSMTGVATAIHTIDHDSPLLELTAEDLENKAINVVFTAHDGKTRHMTVAACVMSRLFYLSKHVYIYILYMYIRFIGIYVSGYNRRLLDTDTPIHKYLGEPLD